MKALVTGGGGFLGRAIVSRLLVGGSQVRVLSRGDYPELAAAGVEMVKGDVADSRVVREAVKGVETVFHVAGKVGLWGSYQDFFKTNVEGTKNLIHACHDMSVPRMVFTGSPSVVFDGRDCEGWNEAVPYPEHFDSYYSQTKAMAEQMVLGANSAIFATVSLRPHLIWGPGDNHIIIRLLEQSKAGKLRRIGGFNKKVDTTYIDDAAEAHYLAAMKLAAAPASIGGRAYFISSGRPVPLWDMINAMLAAGGRPPVTKSTPLWAAKLAASLYEALWSARGMKTEPRLTKFLVSQLTTAHWFDISAARRELGYAPSVSFEEGLKRLSAWLKGGK